MMTKSRTRKCYAFNDDAVKLLDSFFTDNGLGFNFSGLYSAKNNDFESYESNINGSLKEIEVVAPGLKKSDFCVRVDKGVLTINAVQTKYRKSFSKSWDLDPGIDPKVIVASYDEGILKVVFPVQKEQANQTFTIEVK